MDILQALRMRNIFGTPPLPGPPSNSPNLNTNIPDLAMASAAHPDNPYAGIQFGTPPGPATDVKPPERTTPNNQSPALSNIAQRMSEMYTPEDVASDKYNQLINDYPNREDYKPGFWRSIGSMIVDYAKGPQAGHAMYDEPYNDKLTDWKNKIGPAEKAANLERYQNVNERQVASQTIEAQRRQQALDEKTKTDEANVEIRRKRLDIYDWKNRHPNMRIVIPKGGNIYGWNPVTGEKVDLGLDSGTLSEAEKYDLQQENAMNRIQEQGAQARQTEGVKQDNRESIQDQRAWQLGIRKNPETGQDESVMYNAITGEVRPVTMDGKPTGPIAKPGSGPKGLETGGTGMLPTQQRVDHYNQAVKIRESLPELAQFIKLGPGANDFEIVKPGKNFFGSSTGPTQQQYDAIVKAIWGPTGGGITSGAPKAPTGWKYVPKPGGGWTAVPDTQGQKVPNRNVPEGSDY
jgi:hypothetical protein